MSTAVGSGRLFICAAIVISIFPAGGAGSSTAARQEKPQHVVTTFNIEVPVRVFRGDAFVDDLTLADFELLEDGKPQKIEAVYLVRRTTIGREESVLGRDEARKRFAPQAAARQFVLVFDVLDYTIRLGEVIDRFFASVFEPGDSLIVMTPREAYHLKDEIPASGARGSLADELKAKLRRDTRLGNAEYKSIVREIRLGGGRHADFLRLRELRRVEEKSLLDFAALVKGLPGNKNLFLFYQSDSVPAGGAAESPFLASAAELGLQDTFAVDRVKEAFADSSIAAHFLFVTNALEPAGDPELPAGKTTPMAEWSQGAFNAFSQVARATGGLVEASANPAASFDRAAQATENYYLLYYTPANYQADGRFHALAVKVKGRTYRVLHRAGYIAD